MKASSADTGRKVLKQKGGVFQLYSRSKESLDKNIAPIYEAKSGTGYIQELKDITGYIDDVIVQKRFVKRGERKQKVYIIDIMIHSGDDDVILQLDFDQSNGATFAKTFRSINLKKEVTFLAWAFPPEKGEEYGRRGISLYEGAVRSEQTKYEAYYTKDNMPEFKRKSRDGEKFDKEAYYDYLFEKFIEDVHHAFGHYEEKEQEDRDSRSSKQNDRSRDDRRRDDRDDDRGRGRDDKRSSRDDDRGRDDRRRDDRDDDRGRDDKRSSRNDDDEKPRSYRDDDRRSSRDDDRGREKEEDRRSFKDDDEELPF